jgi:acetyl-CoA synthetase/medium-chain acyl-CoA synthetase
MHESPAPTTPGPTYFNFARDVFDGWARRRPDACALWWVASPGGPQSRSSFSKLSAQSRQAAHWFQAMGVQRGDRVLLLLPRIPQWWIAMLGLVRLGAVPVPGTLQLTARDVAYRIEAADIAAVLTTPDGLGKVGEFSGRRLLVGGDLPGWADFDAGLRGADPAFDSEPTRADEPGLVFFTSATTGEPKMVLHTQASYGLGHRLTGEWWLDLAPDDVHWNLSDPGWAKAAWSSFYGPWHMGACVFAFDAAGRFNPAQTLQTLAEHPITTLCAPPTALRMMVREDLSRWRFPRLRHCVTAGEPLNPEVLHRWRAATGLVLHEGYGQTETVVLVGNFRRLGCEVRPGSMGIATPGITVALLDEGLEEVPPGVEGDLAVRVKPERPPGLFREYWGAPEMNAAAFRGDWYLTGDRAVRDAAGYFQFVGRRDDVIKSSGYRIGPFEVESALREHAAVLDVAVIGKTDDVRGQIVKACVVLQPGVVPAEGLKADLQHHCRQLVAPYKSPREIEFVAELPKTISGKTRHAMLRRADSTRRADGSPG